MLPSLPRLGGHSAALLLSSVLALLVTLPPPSEASAFGIPEFLEFGECAQTKNMVDLDISRYSGVWFAQEMVPNEYSQIVSCSLTNYTLRGSLMKVVEKGITAENRKVRQNSVIRPDPEKEEGNYVVEADGVPSAPFQIVDTDYDNYACAHSCMEFMGFRAAFSWIYTRRPDADQSYVAQCRERFTELGIDTTPLQPMKQGKGCPYMEKIQHILSYSESIQSKARETAATARPKVVTTTTPATTTTQAATTTTTTTTTTEASTTTPRVPRRKTTTPPPSEETVHEVEITLIENDLERIEDLENRILEEEERMHREMAEERQRQEEERRRAEEEMRRLEEQRQRQEEERRLMEEERRLMEEERRRMEEERAHMAAETRREEAERREEIEELEELREDVRAEIRRNHRGSKHRTEYTQDAESSSSCLSTNITAILLTVLLTGIFRR